MVIKHITKLYVYNFWSIIKGNGNREMRGIYLEIRNKQRIANWKRVIVQIFQSEIGYGIKVTVCRVRLGSGNMNM